VPRRKFEPFASHRFPFAASLFPGWRRFRRGFDSPMRTVLARVPKTAAGRGVGFVIQGVSWTRTPHDCRPMRCGSPSVSNRKVLRLGLFWTWRAAQFQRGEKRSRCTRFCRRHSGESRARGALTLTRVTLNPDQVFPALAAAILGGSDELIEAPLDLQLRAYADWSLESYTCTARGLVFHARGHGLPDASGVLEGRFHLGHHRRAELGPSGAHAESIGKNWN